MEPNQQVEADIMFYKSYMARHMIDRADRWHVTIQIFGKTAQELCDAIATSWISTFGPFKYLVIDGEKGIMSHDAEAFLKHHGISIKPRAPQQHADADASSVAR